MEQIQFVFNGILRVVKISTLFQDKVIWDQKNRNQLV